MENISIFDRTPDDPLPVEAMFEPGFGYSRALVPDYSDTKWCEGFASYLDRLIARSPNDLVSHVQRINALLAAGHTGDRVFAAALDLNTVLGANGLALQRRIHEQIFPFLDDQQRADLVAIRSGGTLPARSAEKYCSLPRDKADSVQLVSQMPDGDEKNSAPMDFDIGA